SVSRRRYDTPRGSFGARACPPLALELMEGLHALLSRPCRHRGIGHVTMDHAVSDGALGLLVGSLVVLELRDWARAWRQIHAAASPPPETSATPQRAAMAPGSPGRGLPTHTYYL